MKVTIEPGALQGSVRPPASKSMMQRLCAAALLHRGQTTIYNPGISADDKVALGVIEDLGATVSYQTDGLHIYSDGFSPKKSIINCGESGLSARMFTPIAALNPAPVYISGHGSLLKRTMRTIKAPLDQLAVTLSDFNDYVPFTVCGPLQPASIAVDGSEGSQFLSGLLFALSYSSQQQVSIYVSDLKSKPYIDMTLDVLRLFGKPIGHDNYKGFYIEPSRFVKKQDIAMQVEADWSSAGYWIVAGMINGNIKIEGLNLKSNQADVALMDIIGDFKTAQGGNLHVASRCIPCLDIDLTDCPDLFPILSILASCAKGTSRLKGIHRLMHKESNRLTSISDMLSRFGVLFAINDDTLYIDGSPRLRSATIDSCNDHRIVMAAAIAAVNADGPVSIVGAEAVNKSYPHFFLHLQSLGAEIAFTDQ